MYRITREGTFAYNRETKERMQKPKWPDYQGYAHSSEWYPAYYRYLSAMKVWDAFVKALPEEISYKRPNLVHATEKGIPVPRTGSRRWHSGKNSGKTGVIGSSRVLPHRYMDEGDKGKGHNRHIKRLERALWRSEALEELREEQESYYVEEYDWTDYLRLTDPQDYVWVNDDDIEDHSEYEDRFGCNDPYCLQCYGW